MREVTAKEFQETQWALATLDAQVPDKTERDAAVLNCGPCKPPPPPAPSK